MRVSDPDESLIDTSRLRVVATYLPEGQDQVWVATGHQEQHLPSLDDHPLIAASDCKSCHAIDKKSVGPSFQEVAERYANRANSQKYLAKKIITGGSGNWGEHAMSAHPQLSQEQAEEMARFVLAQAKREEM
ncbi:MAG: c-type cytochrome, partial [Cytophagales bacterium]|nr:c-type cytochrome [Cytophagales bacterium]